MSSDDNDDIFDKFLKNNPQCNPDSDLMKGESNTCNRASSDGAGCYFAQLVGYTDAAICTDNDKEKNMKKIREIENCQQNLTEIFSVNMISNLTSQVNNLFNSIKLQSTIFDQRMELFEIQVTRKIDVANLISGTNLIILIIILTYLLFSKFFR
tara:strand:+ start:163 stop:624 length:462 start_codon:yes stop_codon:yes gene_type:complete